ncbi:metal-dependent hydrolase [Candidatus Saccharibacteria bacterium]|nr:MAG: metal-dependent hydrolase [Candidatus Saccharibacteria bacterium]
MTGRTHDLAALTALGAVVLVWPPESVTLGTALLAVLANQLGGIAPDIDQPTAPFWRNLPSTKFVGRIFSKLSGGHRFLSHSILGLIGFGFLFKLLLTVLHPILPTIDITLVWYAFMIGMVSHLVMDMFTKEGVPLLLPVPFKFGLPPVRKFRVTTGKVVEAAVIFPALIGINIWLYASHYTEIMTLLHQNLH